MTRVKAKQFVCAVALLWAVGSVAITRAQLGVGVWAQQKAAGVGMTMTVEPCCKGGFKLTYRVADSVIMTIESPFDGTEVPVMMGGKPSGETMAIKRVDATHTSTVVKMNGQPFGTSKSTLSADGKTLTVENETAAGTKTTEVWTKK